VDVPHAKGRVTRDEVGAIDSALAAGRATGSERTVLHRTRVPQTSTGLRPTQAETRVRPTRTSQPVADAVTGPADALAAGRQGMPEAGTWVYTTQNSLPSGSAITM
jgi:hypothetical protein